jgi:hypothetical protein
MAQVRIRKALQIKNRITGEIANLSKLIQANNSHQDGASRFDVAKLIVERAAAVNKLIAVKTALATANVAIYEKIARMAELKAEIQLYRTLPLSEGFQAVGYGDRAVQVKIVATVNAVDVENVVKARTLDIEKLQDEIDYFNSATEITIPD